MRGRQIEALAEQTADGEFGGSCKRHPFAHITKKPFLDHKNLHLTDGDSAESGFDVVVEQVGVMLTSRELTVWCVRDRQSLSKQIDIFSCSCGL